MIIPWLGAAREGATASTSNILRSDQPTAALARALARGVSPAESDDTSPGKTGWSTAEMEVDAETGLFRVVPGVRPGSRNAGEGEGTGTLLAPILSPIAARAIAHEQISHPPSGGDGDVTDEKGPTGTLVGPVGGAQLGALRSWAGLGGSSSDGPPPLPPPRATAPRTSATAADIKKSLSPSDFKSPARGAGISGQEGAGGAASLDLDVSQYESEFEEDEPNSGEAETDADDRNSANPVEVAALGINRAPPQGNLGRTTSEASGASGSGSSTDKNFKAGVLSSSGGNPALPRMPSWTEQLVTGFKAFSVSSSPSTPKLVAAIFEASPEASPAGEAGAAGGAVVDDTRPSVGGGLAHAGARMGSDWQPPEPANCPHPNGTGLPESLTPEIGGPRLLDSPLRNHEPSVTGEIWVGSPPRELSLTRPSWRSPTSAQGSEPSPKSGSPGSRSHHSRGKKGRAPTRTPEDQQRTPSSDAPISMPSKPSSSAEQSIGAQASLAVRRAGNALNMPAAHLEATVRAVVEVGSSEREAVGRAESAGGGGAAGQSWLQLHQSVCESLCQLLPLRALANAIEECARTDETEGQGSGNVSRTSSLAGSGGGGGGGGGGGSGQWGGVGDGGGVEGRLSSDLLPERRVQPVRLQHAVAAHLARILVLALDGAERIQPEPARELCVPLVQLLLLHTEADVKCAGLDLAFALREPLEVLVSMAEDQAAAIAGRPEGGDDAGLTSVEEGGKQPPDLNLSSLSNLALAGASLVGSPTGSEGTQRRGGGSPFGHLMGHSMRELLSRSTASASAVTPAVRDAAAAVGETLPTEWGGEMAKGLSPECREPALRHTHPTRTVAAALSLDPELVSYAEHLGIEPAAERSLLWLAEVAQWAAHDSILPVGWVLRKAPNGGCYYEEAATRLTTRTHPHAAQLSLIARLQRLEGWAAPFDPRWSPLQLAEAVWLRLVATGLADGSHVLRARERQRLIITRFEAAKLDGSKLAGLNARALEVAVRGAMGGDAGQDALLAALTDMLPPSKSVDVGHRNWHGTLSSSEAKEVAMRVVERQRQRDAGEPASGGGGGSASGGSGAGMASPPLTPGSSGSGSFKKKGKGKSKGRR